VPAVTTPTTLTAPSHTLTLDSWTVCTPTRDPLPTGLEGSQSVMIRTGITKFRNTFPHALRPRVRYTLEVEMNMERRNESAPRRELALLVMNTVQESVVGTLIDLKPRRRSSELWLLPFSFSPATCCFDAVGQKGFAAPQTNQHNIPPLANLLFSPLVVTILY
jgi:hypothetical protein